MGRRLLYVAAEKDPLHLHALRNRFLRTPNVVVQQLDPHRAEEFASMEGCFDTVLCVNVLEYVDDPAAVLAAIRRTLKPNGTVVVLVPQGAALFGSVDRSLGHKRRFRSAEARAIIEAQGLSVEKLYQLNKAGTLPWWLYSRIFSAGRINKPVLKIFDKTVWLWRRIDALLPWPGLSLIVVARSAAAAPAPPPGLPAAVRQESRG
jgi:SAM-dependent methyltransferase